MIWNVVDHFVALGDGECQSTNMELDPHCHIFSITSIPQRQLIYNIFHLGNLMENVRKDVMYFKYITLILSTIYTSRFKQKPFGPPEPSAGAPKPFQRDRNILRKYTNTKLSL